MVSRLIFRIVGTALLVAGALLDWTSSTELGHEGNAFDIPLEFLWSTDAVDADLSIGHVLVALAVLSAITTFVPFTWPVMLAAGLVSFVVAAGYVGRFMITTDIVDPLRALGAGLVATFAGSLALASAARR